MINHYSQDAIDIIKQFEGCRLTAYADVSGIPTIGYGHTGKNVYIGLTITQDQANAFLQSDMDYYSNILNENILNENITQYQYDALESFIFNVGSGKAGVKSGLITLKNGNTSTLLTAVNDGNMSLASAQFAKWTNADGKPSSGLIARRTAEQNLFLGN